MASRPYVGSAQGLLERGGLAYNTGMEPHCRPKIKTSSAGGPPAVKEKETLGETLRMLHDQS